MNVNFPVGTILKVKKEEEHITVIDDDRHGGGFMYYYSDENGTPTEHVRPFHSNCLLTNTLVVTNKQVRFKTESHDRFHWTITGIPEVDREMPNVDLRYELFINNAPIDQVELYRENEENNFHLENAKMVADFANTQIVANKISVDPDDIHVKSLKGSNVITFKIGE